MPVLLHCTESKGSQWAKSPTKQVDNMLEMSTQAYCPSLSSVHATQSAASGSRSRSRSWPSHPIPTEARKEVTGARVIITPETTPSEKRCRPFNKCSCIEHGVYSPRCEDICKNHQTIQKEVEALQAQTTSLHSWKHWIDKLHRDDTRPKPASTGPKRKPSVLIHAEQHNRSCGLTLTY